MEFLPTDCPQAAPVPTPNPLKRPAGGPVRVQRAKRAS